MSRGMLAILDSLIVIPENQMCRNTILPAVLLPFVFVCVAGGVVWAAQTAVAQCFEGTVAKRETPSNFKTENLVAWCIVPFDAKQRDPFQRAEMVRRLGLNRVAYDWRAKHVPEFEQEILAYKKRDIEFFAFWGWHDSMEGLIEKYSIKPQIWQMFTGDLPEGTDEERTRVVAERFLPLVAKTKKLGLQLGIYNHGGWAGEPQNMISVCKYLRKHHQADHVGIVYNFHHGHGHVDGFETTIRKLEPYLICLNINGMVDAKSIDPRTQANKILPVGDGIHEKQMINATIKSGYDGPIGILGHRAEMDAEKSVGLNIVGLKRLFEANQLEEK